MGSWVCVAGFSIEATTARERSCMVRIRAKPRGVRSTFELLAVSGVEQKHVSLVRVQEHFRAG
jgi:hypothetical protein